MKVIVDFSIFTENEGAFGNVSGELDLLVVPQIGDSVSFLFSDGRAVLDATTGFVGILQVTDRIIPANQENRQIALSLSDLVVSTSDYAIKVMNYFDEAFDLFGVRYSEE